MRIAWVFLKRTALVLSVLLAFGIAARCTNMIERHFIYFPEKLLVATPSDRGLDFQDVFFETSDGLKLHGWFVPGRADMTWVWFHGNAGNIGHRVDNIAALNSRLGASVFIFDYRGYGHSEGMPSEQGTYRDAEAALTYLRSREDVDDQKIVLFGRSLGGAIALEAAIEARPYAVILESSFTSIRAMAKRVYPFVPGIGLLVQAKYDSLAKIKNVHAPVMVLHGDRDEIVPFDMGKELFEAANPPKRFYAVEGAGHNDTYYVGGAAYYEALASFLEDPAGGGS